MQHYLVIDAPDKIKDEALEDLKCVQSLTSYLRDFNSIIEKMEHRTREDWKNDVGKSKTLNRDRKKRALIKNSM